MADILSVGTSAANVYRQALTTVSNNIANLNTEGYSRQEAISTQNLPTEQGQSFIGTGASLKRITRSYDQFLEGNLRQSKSELSSQTPLINYSQRIVDIMGDSQSGLAGALDKFFSDAEVLSTDPASGGLRTTFLASSESLVSRIRSISQSLSDVVRDVNGETETVVDAINEKTSQLAFLNGQMASNPSKLSQNPALMDSRDLLLHELSGLVKIKVTENSAGLVDVELAGAGASGTIVKGIESREIGVQTYADATKKSLVSADPAGDSVPLPAIQGGELGGLMSLRNAALMETVEDFDLFVDGFTKEINKIHSGSMDKKNQSGAQLFSTSPVVELVSSDMRAESPATAIVTDIKNTVPSIDITWYAQDKKFLVQDGVSDKWFDSTTATGIGKIKTNGLEIDVTKALSDKQKITLSVFNRPAETIKVGIANGDEIAAADRLRVIVDTANNGDSKASITYDPERADVVLPGFDLGSLANGSKVLNNLISTDNIKPWGYLTAGSTGSSIVLDTRVGNTTRIDLVTKDGVHILGKTPANPALWLTGNSFFNEGVSYSSTYLNKTGSNAFLDLDVTFGFNQAKSSMLPASSPNEFTSDSVNVYTNSTGSSVAWIANGALSLNGTSLNALNVANSSTTSANTLATWLNAQSVATGVSATAVTEINTTKKLANFGQGLTINGTTINNANTATTLSQLADRIGAMSATTGVDAYLGVDDNLVITNTAGNEGKNITIGSTSAPNTLGVTDATYSGKLKLSAASNIKFQVNELSGTLGYISELSKLGISGGVYIDGVVPEDVAVLITDTTASNVTVEARVASKAADSVLNPQPEDPLKLDFLAGGLVTITDTKTNTVVRKQAFDPLKPIIYKGIDIRFDNAPLVGDSFVVEPNLDAPGDNGGIRRIALLQTQPIFVGGRNASDAYTDIVNDMGAKGFIAEISQQALDVVYTQAVEAESAASGVTLDREAADLVRYQQSFQAAAQIIQVSTRLFDSIIQATR